MGHDHGAAGSAAMRHRTPLLIAFGLTAGFMVVEFIVGFAIGSLALVSDAAHMATDVIGLAMALAAITLGARSKNRQRSFGLYRLEVLAALANGVLLFGVAGWVVYQAVSRFIAPPDVPGAPLLITAVLGLIVNLISLRLLAAGAAESLNLKGASLEVLSDLLGSLGVIVAAIIVLTTGWQWADPIVGIAIGLFILPRTWKLMRQALEILLEAAPSRLDLADVRAGVLAVPGVVDIHDLHVWTITSGLDSASVHIVTAPDVDPDQVAAAVRSTLADRFDLTHATVQAESTSASVCDLEALGHE